MNQELMKEFKADLKEFQEMTEKFYAKEVSVKDYKGFSGGFGSYAQKVEKRACSACVCQAAE